MNWHVKEKESTLQDSVEKKDLYLYLKNIYVWMHLKFLEESTRKLLTMVPFKEQNQTLNI